MFGAQLTAARGGRRHSICTLLVTTFPVRFLGCQNRWSGCELSRFRSAALNELRILLFFQKPENLAAFGKPSLRNQQIRKFAVNVCLRTNKALSGLFSNAHVPRCGFSPRPRWIACRKKLPGSGFPESRKSVIRLAKAPASARGSLMARAIASACWCQGYRLGKFALGQVSGSQIVERHAFS